ncbi:MAG: phosphoribosyltransferase family protein [Chloroflexota bacterium]
MSNPTNSYGYENRNGIRLISWEDFHGICKGLAQAVEAFKPEIILAVGRGGFYPGTLISHILRTEIYPVRVSRRVNDVVQFDNPQWHVRPPDIVKDKRVLIVDEISSSGETLQVVKDEAERLGASEVRCAVMYAHSWGTAIPDYIGLISDELLLNPWDREILENGVFQFHPEYAGALEKQGIAPDADLLIDAPTVRVQKG